jgi:signal transduction histidine kinase
MVRAQEGLARLTTILIRMTEAARLEQSLSGAERERFDLGAVVAGCVDGYCQAYPEASIAFARTESELIANGAPDLIAQMLDKLVANAVEFGRGGLVEIRLERDGDEALLSVSNEGPPLPDTLADHLFDSMVSVRSGFDAGEPHLGLGLSIVRLITQFHG